ncbi:hypothetical protein DPMN_055428 [Dreissena polymorpha]|uniref:DUF6589 domain-containing protein n=1 Tax=Dreissena polymorpha TaxID=45954 RepID=A0A9D4CRU8_DREPO|nr:hypothetical protein DPMN_055428 [Dreissena polymorpha]
MASIPLGGDQLTRVTFDSARVLRSGTHSRTERFDQLSPVIEELFHVQQDLLEKIIKTFYIPETAREEGSLAQYRAILHRTNVNGQVKANGYESHKDFLITVTRALVIELACERWGADCKTDLGSLVPEEVKTSNTKGKKQWLQEQVTKVVDTLFCPYSAPKDAKIYLRRSGHLYCVTVPSKDVGKTIDLIINGEAVRIRVPEDCKTDEAEDGVFSYSLGIVRVAMDFIMFNDAIKSERLGSQQNQMRKEILQRPRETGARKIEDCSQLANKAFIPAEDQKLCEIGPEKTDIERVLPNDLNSLEEFKNMQDDEYIGFCVSKFPMPVIYSKYDDTELKTIEEVKTVPSEKRHCQQYHKNSISIDSSYPDDSVSVDSRLKRSFSFSSDTSSFKEEGTIRDLVHHDVTAFKSTELPPPELAVSSKFEPLINFIKLMQQDVARIKRLQKAADLPPNKYSGFRGSLARALLRATFFPFLKSY